MGIVGPARWGDCFVIWGSRVSAGDVSLVYRGTGGRVLAKTAMPRPCHGWSFTVDGRQNTPVFCACLQYRSRELASVSCALTVEAPRRPDFHRGPPRASENENAFVLGTGTYPS